MLSNSELLPILAKLGLGRVSIDRDGLASFYRAWCLGVPFDDLQKMASLFENQGPVLPPLDAREFFANWLDFGTGGTCWQHSDGIYTLAKSLGFHAKRAVASMNDTGYPGHGTVVVHLPDQSTWVLDNAFLTMLPVRIDRGAPSHYPGTYYAEVEHDGEELFVHGYHPPIEGMFFRMIELEVSEEYYAEKWANTHSRGPFVRTLHIRRNFEDRFVVLRGATLYICSGCEVTNELLDGPGICRHLQETFGIAPSFVERWAASGALESTLQPPGPMPEIPQRLAPSKRPSCR